MIRKTKLLICMLSMSMVLTVLPGVESFAEEADGGDFAAASGLQDENSQRLEEVTAMDEDGSIYEISETDGSVAEEESAEISLFSARSGSTVVVNFNTKGNATTSYQDETNGISGYTNGAYGADAAYLGTTESGKIRFMLSGVTGTVSASEVQLVNYETVVDNVSYYTVSGGKLLHFISQDLNRAPSSSLNNGPAPSCLSEGVKYYSYDGHYFYSDYAVMSADYQNGVNGQNAVNAGNPFYNYFQFLDMRGRTGYSGEQLNSILNSAMSNAGIAASVSKLTGTGTAFVENQNIYNVNALLSLSIAVNESGWGTSSICNQKNNIFGLNAVDTSPGESADTFASVEDCIRDFMANWMADGYLSSSDWRNHGEYLGNKGGGINVSYASDPYWGEKAAGIAWNLDAAGENQDYIGMVTDTPDGDTSGTETPDSDTSGTETPDSDTSGTETPDSDISGTETPDNDMSGTETPDSDASGTETPDSDMSGTETPDSDTSGTETPDSDTSGTETPDNDASGTETPDNVMTGMGTPDNVMTGTGTSDSDTSGTETPDSDASGTETPDSSDHESVDSAANAGETAVKDTSVTADKKETEKDSTEEAVESAVKAPKTGDSGFASVWAVLSVVSAGFAIMAVAVMRKRNFRR